MREKIRRVLIANRGEIACRVIRTCHRLGIETVAVFSDADRNAPHARLAGRAVYIGAAPATESYLRGTHIVQVAQQTGCDAIHPGYGFLSENAAFARSCAEHGIRFLGPSADAIEAMGSKAQAKALMEKAGVPVVPGYHAADQRDETLTAEARRIGYPLLVKATAGGGGKGMRVVHSEDELAAALAAARREAASSFGNDTLLLERFVERPRHVEVQILGDTRGRVIHLFERDCSTQRRHQKVIEEAPAPNLPADTRARMLEAGVEAGRAVGYTNAGTVEFLYDPQTTEFYFLEMNTRLQVEHPVTEAITSLDLVEWQLRIAAGERLPDQSKITAHGHAIEARLYAEDPAAGYQPSAGTIEYLQLPDNARFDGGIERGSAITPHYDPMLGKLIVHGNDRAAALDNLQTALANTVVRGLRHNQRFLYRLASDSRLRDGALHTNLDLPTEDPDASPQILAIAASLLARNTEQNKGTPTNPWQILDGFSTGADLPRSFAFEGEADVRLCGYDGDYQVTIADQTHTVRVDDSGAVREIMVDGAPDRVATAIGSNWVQVASGSELFMLSLASPMHEGLGGQASSDVIEAPLPGKVVRVLVAVGDIVETDQEVVILEAMKMEMTVRAPAKARVIEICADETTFVDAHEILLRLEPVS